MEATKKSEYMSLSSFVAPPRGRAGVPQVPRYYWGHLKVQVAFSNTPNFLSILFIYLFPPLIRSTFRTVPLVTSAM